MKNPGRITTTAQVDIAGLDDLTGALQWFRDLLPKTAHEELAKAQAGGSLLDPVTLVDGRKNDDEESVKPFGSIIYVEPAGPLREAIAAAESFVRTAAPMETGFYQSALVWFANGRATGSPPNADKVGRRGNVELVDLAPYASVVEIDVPRGVIFGAYAMLTRRFGAQLSIGFRYADPGQYGGLIERPGNPARVPYKVPVLTIGNPSSTVKPGIAGSRPGHNLRRGRSTFSRRGTLHRRAQAPD